MKTNLFSLFVLAVFALSSCKKEKEEEVNDNSLPSGAVHNIRVTSKTTNQIKFTADVYVFKNSVTINDKLKSDAFIIEEFNSGGRTYQFSRDEASINSPSSKGPYSAALLMDQSGSINSTDPNDFRIDAAKIFCENLGAGDNTKLFAFASSSGYFTSDLVSWGTGFTNQVSDYLLVLEDLKNKVGGGTPLYKSTYQVAATTQSTSPNSNKAVIVFTDGEDTGGGYTALQVANYAKSLNVKLFTVGLGGASASNLGQMANQSGGAFMFAADARQLISMFGNLGELLNGTAKYYQTKWTVNTSSNLPASGWFTTSIRVDLPDGEYILVPMRVDY